MSRAISSQIPLPPSFLSPRSAHTLSTTPSTYYIIRFFIVLPHCWFPLSLPHSLSPLCPALASFSSLSSYAVILETTALSNITANMHYYNYIYYSYSFYRYYIYYCDTLHGSSCRDAQSREDEYMELKKKRSTPCLVPSHTILHSPASSRALRGRGHIGNYCVSQIPLPPFFLFPSFCTRISYITSNLLHRSFLHCLATSLVSIISRTLSLSLTALSCSDSSFSSL